MQQTTHGDPLFQDLALHLLSLPCRLYFEAIWNFIHEATVNTMNGEFFIIDSMIGRVGMNVQVRMYQRQRCGFKSMLSMDSVRNRFKLDESKIPQFLSMPFCQTLFLCGKYIYFIRSICKDLEVCEEQRTRCVQWNVGIVDKSILESTTFNNVCPRRGDGLSSMQSCISTATPCSLSTRHIRSLC